MFTSIQKISSAISVSSADNSVQTDKPLKYELHPFYLVSVQPNSSIPPCFFSFPCLEYATDFLVSIESYDMLTVQKLIHDYNELINPSIPPQNENNNK